MTDLKPHPSSRERASGTPRGVRYVMRQAWPGLRFHDLRHTVVTRLEAGEPDHVVESITGHLSRRMLEHYSHMRLNAKKAALDRLDGSTQGSSIKRAK
jgi:integrase